MELGNMKFTYTKLIGNHFLMRKIQPQRNMRNSSVNPTIQKRNVYSSYTSVVMNELAQGGGDVQSSRRAQREGGSVKC
ncbi:hypothetical protein V6N12_043733 [Hibiscus sabdariffa]|uniref:Uncharacterized protein n=1 Tax=Hibiscus sabdariffa TaxID=183260 RepID=A0ABR2DI38_9ROSI